MSDDQIRMLDGEGNFITEDEGHRKSWEMLRKSDEKRYRRTKISPYKEYSLLPFFKNVVTCSCGFQFKVSNGIETHICPACKTGLDFRD